MLVLTALGVVYGDIGTSPIYALRESVLAASAGAPMSVVVLGILSLLFWSLIVVVTIKYVTFVLRADNRGEGGIMALASLAHRTRNLSRGLKYAIGLASVLGLALFFGEAMLTPAISVLSAVEGFAVEEPALAPLVLPAAVVILLGLFMLQSRGTARVGFLFGPVMIVWFISLAALGLMQIVRSPDIIMAVNPYHAVELFMYEPLIAFLSLGAVVLVVTGVETLYADMGHFGRKPIRQAWLFIVLPALLLNYFGQGALVLNDPSKMAQPFFAMAPDWAHYPLVILTTFATIIASQAVISGIFSMTRQAVQLGHLPRMEIRHTSATDFGQVYVPVMNWLLLIGVLAIVIMFQTSANLAIAYGVAVTCLMATTSTVAGIVAARRWRWGVKTAALVFGGFLLVDLSFLSSNIFKIAHGAWLPILIAVLAFTVIDIWRQGRKIFVEKIHDSMLSTELFLDRADKTPIRVAGTAVFMTPRLDAIPTSFLHNLKHNKVIHERVILLHVTTEDVPFVPQARRCSIEKLGKGFFAVELRFGFFQTPDVPKALRAARAHGLAVDIDETTFFVGHETLLRSKKSELRKWRARIFMALHHSALAASTFFRLPPGRIIELGTQVEI